ncbi:MAG: hypothetical protein ACOY93_22455 [Bacillota bacterium]
MPSQEQLEVWGLSDYDIHRIAHYEKAQYTSEELAALGHFFRAAMMGQGIEREQLLRRWESLLPTRGETGMVALAEAYWQDGLRGPLIAGMLGREPEEPDEE